MISIDSQAVRDRGYAVLGTLDDDVVRAARRKINEWIRRGMVDVDRANLSRDELLQEFEWTTYGDRALRGSEEMHACFRPFEEVVRALVGRDVPIRYGPDHNQIALRFPGSCGSPHIDGGLAESLDELHIPSAIVLVYLSDVGPDDGPFSVWPNAIPRLREWAGRTLAYPPERDTQKELIELMLHIKTTEPPVAVTGPAGTVIISHPVLPHCNGLASGSNIRYSVIRRYYRDGRQVQNRTEGLRIIAGRTELWESLDAQMAAH